MAGISLADVIGAGTVQAKERNLSELARILRELSADGQPRVKDSIQQPPAAHDASAAARGTWPALIEIIRGVNDSLLKIQLHTIGNLTLLTGNLNAKVSNGPWIGKKQAQGWRCPRS